MHVEVDVVRGGGGTSMYTTITHISDGNDTTVNKSELSHESSIIGYHEDNSIGIRGDLGVGSTGSRAPVL